MENMINFGIDLGTTNSAIAKFLKGEVQVYNNPMDYGRSTLPSVVAFKKDKIFVGSKAKELLEKDPKSVIGTFKRKMGTSESFPVKVLNRSVTPIELSSMILKELKTFILQGETIEAAVITIPASFDTTQSNATKEAGMQTGFKQVVLLQEPIAASLAYANMKKEKEMQDGQWLVYDLGGGTFDVALIKIKDGEMKVLDHEGDNFLGGADFDRLIVEKVLIPFISEKYAFENLEKDLKSASGKFNAKYYVMLRQSEDAKIQLSAKSSAEITVDGFEDDNGDEVDEEITITRSEFNELIKEYVDSTTDMVKKILTRNSLKPEELQFTLMVGGSTYIPYVRQRVEEILQIPINCEIDPTSAIAVGAAYYAATKPKQFIQEKEQINKTSISIRTAYQKVSKEKEEFFSAKVSGDLEGLFYRITREDGGFDTGLKMLVERINEDLPLVKDAFNFFKLTVYDEHNNVIETNLDMIGINSGFGISGQPIPEDICLEVDDEDSMGETKLLLAFQKNSVLPLKRTIPRILNKTVIKGSTDEVIRINILEGPHYALPEANKPVGYIEITGKNLSRDVYKGSDVEISLQISESRDLTVSAYLNMADQEFKETFKPKLRHTSVNKLKVEIENLSEKLDEELDEATKREEYEKAKELSALKKEAKDISENTESLTEDDVTDQRYQLEDKKRKLAQAIHRATQDKKILEAKDKYFSAKQDCYNLLVQIGNDYEQKIYNDIVNQENAFLTSNSIIRIDDYSNQMDNLYWTLWRKHPGEQTKFFMWLKSQKARMNENTNADALVKAGDFAIQSESIDRLCELNYQLLSLLPKHVTPESGKRPVIGF